MKANRNSYKTLPYIPYNIVSFLINDPEAENIWKILKYSDYDCLSKPNLTTQEKVDLICLNQQHQEDYNIFLNNLIENMIPNEKTILKIYRVQTTLDTKTKGMAGIALYKFDVLYGGKMAVIEYDKTPCNRGDVFEMELLKCLNGAEIQGGAGLLEYSSDLSRLCGSSINWGNQDTYSGHSIIMGIRILNVNGI